MNNTTILCTRNKILDWLKMGKYGLIKSNIDSMYYAGFSPVLSYSVMTQLATITSHY